MERGNDLCIGTKSTSANERGQVQGDAGLLTEVIKDWKRDGGASDAVNALQSKMAALCRKYAYINADTQLGSVEY